MNHHPRNAKSKARCLMKTVASKSDEASESENAVVTVDPFMVNSDDGKTFGFFAPAIKETMEAHPDKGKYTCQWQLGIAPQGTCGDVSESVDHLTEHVMEEHANGTQGFTCNWVGCAKRRTTIFNTTTQFKEHLKLHMIITPEAGNDEDISGNLSDKSNNEQSDSDDTDLHGTGEEFSNKRKFKPRRSKRKAKRARSEEHGSARGPGRPPKTVAKPATKSDVHGSARGPERPPKTVVEPATKSDVPRKEFTPVALTFFRFTCLWEVPFLVNSGASPKLQKVTCSRKFTVLEESINHLHGHHFSKIRNKKGPYKCYWKQCGSKDKEFKTIKKLEEHVLIHTE